MNSTAAPDLDTRPAEMTADALAAWAQTCPHCGYVGSRVSDRTTVDAGFLQTAEYRTCLGVALQSELAKTFLRLYLVKKADGDARNAFWSALQAGWASDDVGDAAGAEAARNLAAEQLAILVREKPAEENWKCIMLDVLRRARRFDDAAAFGASLAFADPLLARVSAFEQELAAKGDSGKYTVDDLPKA